MNSVYECLFQQKYEEIFQWNIYDSYHYIWCILSWNTLVTTNVICIATKRI